MEKSFEKIYSAGKEKGEKKEVAIEIPKEEWQTIEIITKRVGGDFGMKVKLGNPGDGSFFNSEDGSITFDPLHIKDNIEQAKFVAGHEGSHKAITPGPKEIGLSPEQIKELYSQIGFDSLQNAIEDPVVNDWMIKRFSGLKEYTEKTYDEQLKEEGAILGTPKVQRIASQLGYIPKFAQYNSEIIRDWHQKKFSEKLDPAVEKALKRTISLARESISIIPDPQKPSRDKKEVITAGQKRFENNTNYIWPEVKKLVEMDLHTEEKRQMLNDFREKEKKLEGKREEIKGAQKSGDKERQGELQKEIDGLKKELDPFNGLPENVKKELQEEIDEAIREGAKRHNQEIEEKQKQTQETSQKQEELEKETQELEEKTKGASGKEKEDLEREAEKKKAEKLEQELKQKQAEQELKDVQDALDKLQQETEGAPYPEDKLSEKTKQELDKLFKKLPKEKQKEIEDKAKKSLEDFEDAINKEMEGKLNEDKPESHKEIRKREEREKGISKEKEQTEKEKKELEKKLEQMRREKMTEYDKAYEETADIINTLYSRLKKFFLPERHPKWQKGYPTGQRVELEKAMQAEVDPRYLEKLWERKTIPHKFDYRFSLLVDLSGSMQGEKIEQTFKGLVVLAEVLEKLGIQFEIMGFSNQSEIFKSWREKMDKNLRDKLAKMKSWGGEGTETTEATQRAHEELSKNLGKDNFLITLTDGQPNNSGSLKQELERIKKEKKLKLVGIGLGPDTEFVKEFYKAAFSLAKLKVTEQERREGQKDFSEAFADLLEDMIRHPEKY